MNDSIYNITECDKYYEHVNCGNFYHKCKIEKCCEHVVICAQKSSNDCKNNLVKIKIEEEQYFNIIRSLKCEYKCGDFELLECYLISTYFYLFFQSEYNKKNNILCVVRGKINIDNLAICNTISIQMCYNLYNLFKNCRIDRSLTKNLRVVQITYSYYDDVFLLLMNGNNKTIIGQIEHLESIHSIGTQIEFMHTSTSHHNCKNNYDSSNFICNVLIIDHSPVCICVINKKKYNLIVFNECSKHNKCYTIKSE